MHSEAKQYSSQKNGKLKQLNLALQGGGAHGAFTWGVLDRLLEDEFLTFDTVSGTSAGAVNAVAMAQGLMEGGPEGARECLATIWRETSKSGDFLQVPTMMENPVMQMTQAMMDMFNTFDVNALAFDPLRDILKKYIDFEALNKESPFGIYVAATHVGTGKARIFSTEELSLSVILASTCLPFFSKSVTVKGEQFWDGGFSANPALRPVIFDSNTDDTLLVQISSMDDYNLTFPGMSDQFNQISFSKSLKSELQLIEAERDAAKSGRKVSEKAKRMYEHRFHLIDGSPITAKQNIGSEMTPTWAMLAELYNSGYACADEFLDTERHLVGVRSSVNLAEHFGL